MSIPKTIGLPRMENEPGEKRVFLPDFVHYLVELGAEIHIEEAYGARSGFRFEDYKLAHPNIHLCSREEAFQKDVCLILRSPRPEELTMVKRGTTLISMLHYPTRPLRVSTLKKMGIKAISLDSIANDNNIRLVENMKAVAWNGIEAAFDWLEKIWPDLVHPHKRPFQVLIIGTGMVGKHAIEAATKLGNLERNRKHIASNKLGAIAISIGRNIAPNAASMETLFRQADILVDTTQRRDTSKPVVPNDWIAWLPEHAVVVDLSVDPYTLDANPPVVRGIEGTPKGNLDQYVFPADDPKWDSLVPKSIPSKHRRTTVTCYSWPGIHPEACMQHYGKQLEPLMYHLLKKGYEGISLKGDYFERALYRGTLKAWLQGESDRSSMRPKQKGSE